MKNICTTCCHACMPGSQEIADQGYVGCDWRVYHQGLPPGFNTESGEVSEGWISGARYHTGVISGKLINLMILSKDTIACGRYSKDERAVPKPPEEPKEELLQVECVYFKPSGKFYAEGKCMVTKKALHLIWEEIEAMPQHPGLAGRWSGIISINVPDHENNHPHLIPARTTDA